MKIFIHFFLLVFFIPGFLSPYPFGLGAQSPSGVKTKIENRRIRDYGIKIGILKPGPNNAITDVKGVKVGHYTLVKGENIRTGVTAVLPHGGNIFQEKVPAAIYIGNGFGKLAGFTQVEELGDIETPIILTNTLSVPTAADALIDHTLSFAENKEVRSVNPVVGETNDGWLNDIQGRHIKKEHVLAAIQNASAGVVEEGAVGAGTGTTCFGFKGGIGTSSRVLPKKLGGYTVGVLVQTNFGGILRINGAPVGIELRHYYLKEILASESSSSPPAPDGSCMIVVMTDAPLEPRNLKRLAKRASLGLARTGGIMRNGSGDYVIAVSTAEHLRIPYKYDSASPFKQMKVLRNDVMSPLFLAVVEAVEEAVLNSLFAASAVKPVKTIHGGFINPFPVQDVLKILKKYNRLKTKEESI
ncbi:MAG: S58 family peptidase [Candidatus Aminicenantes bacterium]|nr:S58 family peptidase [Candidatus Aminicenantes bacterium]NIM78826.1 S58 family peptidase [Candidatus Aminicenantes bacterium]NIN18081.1 S58 family peptidase [Candidatus Aminicenantes bacterium]NIN41980.1 S58 family peptidase [Candidatus Aminicenantes bacterium]NIN84736.1 S58 family peptidase [Candidatus Aminicenantes bacterium]